ncbi:unnamed protein product [Amoebophrya sp. A25]|nr:unnamed protein product [Amoebophrya sp. A25]|eukprot:GSA25T00006577001.1
MAEPEGDSKAEEGEAVVPELPRAESSAGPRQRELERVASIARSEVFAPDTKVQTMPLRQYLDSQIVPTLLPGLAAVAKERPDNPVEFLAHFLMSNKQTSTS